MLPPRRSAVFSGNAEYPDKIPQDGVTQPYFARKIGCDPPRHPPPAEVRRSSWVPLAALDQDRTQRLDVVGHDPVRPPVQEAGHPGAVVDGPHVHVKAEGMGAADERPGDRKSVV